jgi:hypothetical protein
VSTGKSDDDEPKPLVSQYEWNSKKIRRDCGSGLGDWCVLRILCGCTSPRTYSPIKYTDNVRVCGCLRCSNR